MPKFLHVGCGTRPKSQTTHGFQKECWQEIRLDIDKDVNPDIVGSITDMQCIADSSFDAVFSSHNIEHLYAHEVTPALSEFFRVTKPDGFIVITCPDLQSVCELVVEDKLTEPAYNSPAGPITPLDIIFGHRPSIASGNSYMAHRCGFTAKVLSSTLQSVGFGTVGLVRRLKPFFDLWAIGLKPKDKKERVKELSREHVPQQTSGSN